jgi:hypothetical protein
MKALTLRENPEIGRDEIRPAAPAAVVAVTVTAA